MSRLASEANREAAAQPERSKGTASGRHDSTAQPGSPGGSVKAGTPRTAVAVGADLEVTRRVGSAPRSVPGRETCLLHTTFQICSFMFCPSNNLHLDLHTCTCRSVGNWPTLCAGA